MVRGEEVGSVNFTFVIDFAPQPKQRTANAVVGGKVRHFTPDATRTFEKRVAQLAWLEMRKQEIRMTTTPVSLTLYFHFKVPESLSKAKQLARIGTQHTIKPDLTNLCKSIEDGCNGVVYRDDSQISFISMSKTWGSATEVIVTFSWDE
jgi:Holliday junction resolvase RusA-like endonuclease